MAVPGETNEGGRKGGAESGGPSSGGGLGEQGAGEGACPPRARGPGRETERVARLGRRASGRRRGPVQRPLRLGEEKHDGRNHAGCNESSAR